MNFTVHKFNVKAKYVTLKCFQLQPYLNRAASNCQASPCSTTAKDFVDAKATNYAENFASPLTASDSIHVTTTVSGTSPLLSRPFSYIKLPNDRYSNSYITTQLWKRIVTHSSFMVTESVAQNVN